MTQATRPTRHHRQTSRIASLLSTNKHSDQIHDAGSRKAAADEETIAFIKRTLCAHSAEFAKEENDKTGNDRPLEELLPPLTSSPDLDIQLYAFLAIILSTVVQAWYNKITPDSYFVSEIVNIIAHCTRAIEERLKHTDLETLLLDELPATLNDHLDGMEQTNCQDVLIHYRLT
jgi:hypothetical protein